MSNDDEFDDFESAVDLGYELKGFMLNDVSTPIADTRTNAKSPHGRSRHSSVSSFLDIRPLNFALEPTSFIRESIEEERYVSLDTDQPPATLGLYHAVSLVIGCIIGSGIFASPGPVLAGAGSIGATFIVWILSGIISAFGARCYAELGRRFPYSGGEPVYLEKAYGESIAFLYEWSAVFGFRPGGHAIVLIVFADYLSRALFTEEQHDASISGYLWQKGIAVAGITIISIIHAVSLKFGHWTQSAFTIIKLASVAAIASVGLAVLVGFSKSPLHLSGQLHQNWFENTNPDLSGWGLAFYSALFAYDGYNSVNYVAGELKRPERDLPRAIVIGLSAVCVCYLLVNLAYLAVIPKDVLSTSAALALEFSHRVFGKSGGIITALAVAISAFGAAIGSVFTGSRLIHAAASRGHLPSLLGQLHPKRMTPVWALLFQHVLTCIYIFSGTFTSLVKVFGFQVWIYYGLCAFAVWRLRKSPKNSRRDLILDILRYWWLWIFLTAVCGLLVISVWMEWMVIISAFFVNLSGIAVWEIVLSKNRANSGTLLLSSCL